MAFVYTQLAPFFQNLRSMQVFPGVSVLNLIFYVWITGLTIAIVLPVDDEED